MSTADIDLLGPPQADDLYNPEFAVVLRGYDPEEVRAYVQNVAAHIEAIQRQLGEAREQIEAGRRQYMAAKEAAYKQLATQMADLLHTADMEAERLKREGSEEAARTTSEAERMAQQTRREADAHAEELRHDGEEKLWRARAESDRILGGLSVKRDEILKELESTRGRLRGVMASLESTITVTRDEAKRGSEAAVVVAEQAHQEVAAMEPPWTSPASIEASAGEQEADAVMEADAETDVGERAEAEAPGALSEEIDPIVVFHEPTPEVAGWDARSAGWTAEAREERGQHDAMLDSIEGFDLVLPDVRIDEEGELN